MAMKLMMVEGRYKGKIDLSNLDTSMLPGTVGLATTVQFLDYIDEITNYIESKGIKIFIDRARQKYEGQVLGCDAGSSDKIKDKVDAFLYVGSGRFHPLGVRGKKIYALDIERMKVEEVDTSALEKRRYANIYNAKDARTFAILVTTKKGQNELLEKAEVLKKRIEENGRIAFTLVMNEINDANLLGIRADAFVNTACPRIVEDHFSKPIINAEDLDKVLE